MNRKLYPLKHARAMLTERQIQYLSLHLDNPFISHADVRKQMSFSKSEIKRITAPLARKVSNYTFDRRIAMFYLLQWISPIRINALTVGLKPCHQKCIDYLFQYPYHSLSQLASALGISHRTARTYFNLIYRVYGLSNYAVSYKRLRLYHAWMWYQPFDFWSESYD